MSVPSLEQEIEHLAEQCSNLLCENEQLRAALQEIAKRADTGGTIARRALEKE